VYCSTQHTGMAENYCTTANFEIAPGLWTHNYTSDALASTSLGAVRSLFVG